MKRSFFGSLALTILLAAIAAADYKVVDTGQYSCYDSNNEITCPFEGQSYYGQDAQYQGNQPVFTVSGDRLTVYDQRTGLTWQKTPDTDFDGDVDSDDKLSWNEIQDHPATLNALNYGDFDDWRLPTIKESYSLIDFRGIDPSGYQGSGEDLVPFIDTDYYDFAYGDEGAGERLIDAQYWSSTEYVGKIFMGENGVFGVNFADGRIKCYPRDTGPGGEPMTQFLRCVRGNSEYGVNAFVANGDGTVTDTATGLIWMQADNGEGLNWLDALTYAEALEYAGYDDWRLPNAKELQSILDYTRSPSTTGSAAIDPVFTCTAILDEGGETNYPFYWTGTTHANWTEEEGYFGAYIAFGEALGWMEVPPDSGDYVLMDVHGAGAQRSDPKEGDPGDWPYGHGPQGDVIRIFNFVRCVRDAGNPEPTVTPGSNTPTPDTASTYTPSAATPTPNPAPTSTPDPRTTATPTLYPTPNPLGTRLEMPAVMFHPGDPCYLNAWLDNPDAPMTDVPLAVVLDVYGVYWFWPAWTHSMDYQEVAVANGSTVREIIPGFNWPDTGEDNGDNLWFYGAMLTENLGEVLGEFGSWSFAYGSMHATD